MVDVLEKDMHECYVLQTYFITRALLDLGLLFTIFFSLFINEKHDSNCGSTFTKQKTV